MIANHPKLYTFRVITVLIFLACVGQNACTWLFFIMNDLYDNNNAFESTTAAIIQAQKRFTTADWNDDGNTAVVSADDQRRYFNTAEVHPNKTKLLFLLLSNSCQLTP